MSTPIALIDCNSYYCSAERAFDPRLKGVPVVVTTRVHNGRVMPSYGFEGGGKTSYDAGAIMAGDLKAPKARILLMLALQAGQKERAQLQALFDK